VGHSFVPFVSPLCLCGEAFQEGVRTMPITSGPVTDPITQELIRNALDALVDEMALTLVRTAYSSNLKNSLDLSAAVCDAEGRLVAQGLTLPLHLGSVPEFMRAVRARFGAQLRPVDL